jgi:hypothetical protein
MKKENIPFEYGVERLKEVETPKEDEEKILTLFI